MTSDKKQYCEALYKEYQSLADKTRIHVQSYIPGKPLEAQYIKPEELLRKEEIRKELLDKCRDFLKTSLKPDEFFEIENG